MKQSINNEFDCKLIIKYTRRSTEKQRNAIKKILDNKDRSYYPIKDFKGDINSFDDCHKYLASELKNAIKGIREYYLDAMEAYFNNFDY